MKFELRDLLHIGAAIGAIALAYQLGCATLNDSVIRYPADNYGILKYDNDKCKLTCIDGKTHLNGKDISCRDLVFRVKWNNNGKQEASDSVKELEPFNCNGLDKRIAVDTYEK